MTLSTVMVDKRFPALPLIVFLFVSCLMTFGCDKNSHQENEYATLPHEISRHSLMQDSDTLKPVIIKLYKDTLFISYQHKAVIDKFSLALEKIGTILLDKPEEIVPTSFSIGDSLLMVSNHDLGVIVTYDRDGNYIESFNALPDHAIKLKPIPTDYYGGVLYVGDINLHKVLAISMVTADNITAPGELILSIPPDSNNLVGLPSALSVTPDGRLLVGDADDGMIKVFTCDGRYIYNFDSVIADKKIAPLAFARDNIKDMSLQDSTSFDPSGIRSMGRIHVVDAANGQIHMFNPLGRYIASYPQTNKPESPSSAAISHKRRKIYVADPAKQTVIVYAY